MHDYGIGDQVYVEMTGIYQNIYYKKQEAYRTKELFTNCIFWVQQGKVEEQTNIR